MKTVKATELKIGDVVKIAEHTTTFSHSTVIQIEDGWITLFRPYVHLANFTYTGGVIPYLGTEKYKVPVSSPKEFIWLDNIYRGPVEDKEPAKEKVP